MKRTLVMAAAMMALTACGDVETWQMVAYDQYGTVLSEKYTTTEERCRKHGRAAMAPAQETGANSYTCTLVAFQENFPGGERGARSLAWLVKLLDR